MNRSFPTRERGLKSHGNEQRKWQHLSFPTRERGLKYSLSQVLSDLLSRSPRGNVD